MHVYLGFTRSKNMLKLNIESLLQIFADLKHNRQLHKHEEISITHNIDNFPGKAYS